VNGLYERLKGGDCTALAPLLKRDIEFIRDPQAMRALVTLKYSPDYSASDARKELRRIGNIVAQRPGRRNRLPHGDRLQAELQALTQLIKEKRLLEVKKDPAAVRRRLLEKPGLIDGPLPRGAAQLQVSVAWGDHEWQQAGDDGDNPPQDHQDALYEILQEGVRLAHQYVRSARSWALNAMSCHYKTDPKQIEKTIRRDLTSGSRHS
jgi:hypothetical protein